jgi:hypothetical protein
MVVSAFCFTSNLGKIFSFKRRPGPFACFDCLRAMSALWVILGHTQLWESFYNLNSFRISAGNDSINSSFLGQVLNTESFTLSVDTFFFLSSFLAGYFILKELSKKPNLSVLRLWFSKFINRAVRIWACFAFTLFFSWLVAPTMTNGSPGVPGNAIVASCDGDGWWRALLYVGNIGKAERGAKRRAYSNDAGDVNCASLDFCTRRAPLPIAAIFLILTTIPTLFVILFTRHSPVVKPRRRKLLWTHVVPCS